jgi:disulfide bond formation protein DsbB
MLETTRPPRSTIYAWTALLMGVVAVGGSLYLSSAHMGLKACPLCFYQRTFAMAVIGILVIGLLSRVDATLLSLLALPSAVGGLGVAIFHVYLVQTGKLECPKGLLDLGPAPVQSLAAYALMLFPLLADVFRARAVAGLAAVVLGSVFVWASISFNPAPPPAPDKPYPKPPDICRVPYRETPDAPMR